MKKLIGINELAEWLGISPKTIYSWVMMKRIPYVKLGRLVKFDPVDIEAWIKENKVPVRDEEYVTHGSRSRF